MPALKETLAQVVLGKNISEAQNMSPSEVKDEIVKVQSTIDDTEFVKKIIALGEREPQKVVEAFTPEHLAKVISFGEFKTLSPDNPFRKAVRESVSKQSIDESNPIWAAVHEESLVKIISQEADRSKITETATALGEKCKEFDMAVGITGDKKKDKKEFEHMKVRQVKGEWDAKQEDEITDALYENVMGLVGNGGDKNELSKMVGGLMRVKMINVEKSGLSEAQVKPAELVSKINAYNILVQAKANRLYETEKEQNHHGQEKQMKNPNVTAQEQSVLQTAMQSFIKNGKTAAGISAIVWTCNAIGGPVSGMVASATAATVMTAVGIYSNYKKEKELAEKEGGRPISKSHIVLDSVLQNVPYALTFMPGAETMSTVGKNLLSSGAMVLKTFAQEAIDASRKKENQEKSSARIIFDSVFNKKTFAKAAGAAIAGILGRAVVPATMDTGASMVPDSTKEFLAGLTKMEFDGLTACAEGVDSIACQIPLAPVIENVQPEPVIAQPEPASDEVELETVNVKPAAPVVRAPEAAPHNTDYVARDPNSHGVLAAMQKENVMSSTAEILHHNPLGAQEYLKTDPSVEDINKMAEGLRAVPMDKEVILDDNGERKVVSAEEALRSRFNIYGERTLSTDPLPTAPQVVDDERTNP